MCVFIHVDPLFMFNTDVDSLLKKSESQHESPEDGCPFGPLTQRLLQALVEVRLKLFYPYVCFSNELISEKICP